MLADLEVVSTSQEPVAPLAFTPILASKAYGLGLWIANT